jgi:hypothetical protein
VLLAVMLVAVSILPDGPTPAPPTLPGETRSGPVRTPQPVTLGELGLASAPALVPVGAGLASVTFTTSVIPPPSGPSGPGEVVTGPPGGPTRGPGFGPGGAIRRPGATGTDVPGKALGHLKRKGESGLPRRGPGFLRCEEESATGKPKAKGRCDGPGATKGNGNGPGGGKGSGKRGSSGGGALFAGGSGGSASGNHGLGHVKAKGNGHGKGRNKGHWRFGR